MSPKACSRYMKRRFGRMDPIRGMLLKSDLSPSLKYIMEGRMKAKIEVMIEAVIATHRIHSSSMQLRKSAVDHMESTRTM
jgi:hypothetical protein